ncbi:MAG TPA: hypothetical protein VMQ81_12070, partial [Acidimicrobiia bacterium]|nr:hypothetical protein [Acidimicrobiia bacterium]
MRRHLLIALAALLSLTASAALADTYPGPPSVGGGVGEGNFFVGIIAPGQSGFVAADDPNGPRPYTYTWVP